MENKIKCPIINKMIDEIDCYEVHTVMWNMASDTILRDDVRKTDNYKEICTKCENHREE